MTQIFEEIKKERERQNKMWGEQNHPMFQDENVYMRWIKTQSIDARSICKHNEKLGKLTWYDILVEEVSKAFAETDPARQRKK